MESVVGSTTKNPDGSSTLVHQAVVGASIDQLWQAISTADGWKTWAVPTAWSEGDILETSYDRTAKRGDASTIQQRIIAQVPGSLLVFRTVKAPRGFPNFETFRLVTHAIALEPADDGKTRARMVSGSYPDSEAGRQLLGFFLEGNRISIERLRAASRLARSTGARTSPD